MEKNAEENNNTDKTTGNGVQKRSEMKEIARNELLGRLQKHRQV